MNRKVAIAATGILLSLTLGGLAAYPQIASSTLFQIAQNAPATKPMSLQEQLVNANTQFGFKLFSTIVSGKSAQNVVISPNSIAIALSMLYNGAGSKTQQEMANTLFLQGIKLTDVNAANLALSQALEKNDDSLTLTIANSLWLKQGLSLRHQFSKTNRQFYQAQVTNLNFASPEALGIINRWVAEQTNDNIDRIIDKIEPNDALFLINAVYFKGNWAKEFDAKLTKSQTFYAADGSEQQQPFMARQDEYQYYENDRFQAIALPYGDGSLSMYLFLPRQDSNLTTFLSQLSAKNWNQWLSLLKPRQGLLKMPRFKSEYETDLKNVLSALGMKSVFDANQADFSRMTSGKVGVDRVNHKTLIEVNETGTEASAATGVGVQITSAMPDNKPFEMIVNRPFFFAIRDRDTGSIVFMGTIAQPNP